MTLRRNFLLSAALLLTAACIFSSCSTVPRTMAPGAFTTVVIDAGHGGKDSGERSRGGLVEKALTLDTAVRLQPILERAGLHTVMTRTDDTFVELNDRVAIADRYPDAVMLSIHYNASPNSAPRGIQTYFWNAGSYGLALRVQRSLVQETGLDNRGVTRRVLRLTRNPRIPSILCECGFLTNPGEAATVSSGDFRQRVAEGLADGILDQQEHGDIGIGMLPPLAVTPVGVHHRHHALTHHRHQHRHVRRRRHVAPD